MASQPGCTFESSMLWSKENNRRMEEIVKSYQCDDGTLRSELSGTEQRPDKPVDLLLLWVMLVVVQRNLGFLEEESRGWGRRDGKKR